VAARCFNLGLNPVLNTTWYYNQSSRYDRWKALSFKFHIGWRPGKQHCHL